LDGDCKKLANKNQNSFPSRLPAPTYFGTFKDDQVVVTTALGTESNPFGKAQADIIARVLLRNIILRSRRQ